MLFCSWKTVSVNHREVYISFVSFSWKKQNYSLPELKVFRKALENISSFICIFFLQLPSHPKEQHCVAEHLCPGCVGGWPESRHTQPPTASGVDEWQLHLQQEGARQEVCPGDCTLEPFSGGIWTLPSSSWRRITQDLITTTWWQPSERSSSLNMMVWTPRLARHTLKWLLLETVSAYQGKDHSINVLFLAFFLQASVIALCQRQDIGSLDWLSEANLGFMVRSVTATKRKSLNTRVLKNPLIVFVPFF